MRGEQGSSPQGVVAKGWLGPRRDSEESTARGRCGAEELRGEHLESLARSVAPSEGCPRRCTALDSGGRRGGGGRFGSDGRRKRGKRARTTALLLLHIGEACQQRVARRTYGGQKVAHVGQNAPRGSAHGAGSRGLEACRPG